MKRVFFILLLATLFTSCEVKYKEEVHEDGTHVLTVDTSDSELKSIRNEAISALHSMLTGLASAPVEHRTTVEETKERMDRVHNEMDSISSKYFSELHE